MSLSQSSSYKVTRALFCFGVSVAPQDRTGGTPGGDGGVVLVVVAVVDGLDVVVVVVFVLAAAALLLLEVLSTKKPTNKNRNPLVIFCPQCRNFPGKIKACPR